MSWIPLLHDLRCFLQRLISAVRLFLFLFFNAGALSHKHRLYNHIMITNKLFCDVTEMQLYKLTPTMKSCTSSTDHRVSLNLL